MRAWHFSAAILLVGAWACGGTDAIDDGGTDGSPQNDGTTGNDVNNPPPDGSVDDVVTTGDGGNDGTTTEAGPFDPSQLGTNLVLWLDGAKGVTKDTTNVNNVVTWADQTSYHNDATGGTGQFPHQPTINATAINNLPAVEFSGSFQGGGQFLQITDSASLEFGPGDFAVFMVAEYTNTTTGNGASQGTFYAKVAGNTTPTGPQLFGNAGGPNNTLVASVRARININDNVNSAATTYNDGKFHRVGIRRTGTTLEVWADGTATSFVPDAGGAVDVSATGSDAFIGNNGQGQNRLAGGIAEVIGVKGTLSSGDVTNLDGYFKSKYGL